MKKFKKYLSGLGLSEGSIKDDMKRINMMLVREIDYTKGDEYARYPLEKSDLSQSSIKSCLRLCRRYNEYLENNKNLVVHGQSQLIVCTNKKSNSTMGNEKMLPKAFGKFSSKGDYIYRTEARLVWGDSGNNLGLIIMLNPGSSKLQDNNLWDDLVDKKINQADGELLLDDTMKALAAILEEAHPCLNGILHIKNLFNIRNSNSADALALYEQHSKGIIALDGTLLHSDFKGLLEAGNGYKNFTNIDNPWIWLGWTVEDKKFLNLRKLEILDICQNLSKQVHYFAIYSKSKKYKNAISRIHTYHPCPQRHMDKIQYKDDMIAQMKEYFHLPKVYIEAMSKDMCYVLLKWEDSYALEENGISLKEAGWYNGNGLATSVAIKGDYEWFDDPILYEQKKGLKFQPKEAKI